MFISKILFAIYVFVIALGSDDYCYEKFDKYLVNYKWVLLDYRLIKYLVNQEKHIREFFYSNINLKNNATLGDHNSNVISDIVEDYKNIQKYNFSNTYKSQNCTLKKKQLKKDHATFVNNLSYIEIYVDYSLPWQFWRDLSLFLENIKLKVILKFSNFKPLQISYLGNYFILDNKSSNFKFPKSKIPHVFIEISEIDFLRNQVSYIPLIITYDAHGMPNKYTKNNIDITKDFLCIKKSAATTFFNSMNNSCWNETYTHKREFTNELLQQKYSFIQSQIKQRLPIIINKANLKIAEYE